MALSLKKYILKKFGLLRSLSSDQRNHEPHISRMQITHNVPLIKSPARRSALARIISPPHVRPHTSGAVDSRPGPTDPHQPLQPDRPLTPGHYNEGYESPNLPPRRFFSHRVVDRSRVSPAGSQRPTSALVTSSGPDPAHLKLVRNRRLMKEYREISRNTARHPDPLFTVELINDCLYEWRIHLRHIDPASDLHRDLQELRIGSIQLSMTFPENFPFSPPFVRVLSPRIERGFVMEGGAICMELLTPRGWASAYTVEAIIMQLASSIVKGQVRLRQGTLQRMCV